MLLPPNELVDAFEESDEPSIIVERIPLKSSPLVDDVLDVELLPIRELAISGKYDEIPVSFIVVL